MLKGFKDFIMRGNVVDLAVGIVIGAAFTAVVTTFTKSFLEPLIRLASGGKGIKAGGFHIRDIYFDVPAFINGVIAFLLTAATLYFLVVVPMNKLAGRRGGGGGGPAGARGGGGRALTEIRDALVARRVPEQADPRR
ncbi:large conductance mechanosensitive channel protein MscL [Micromonospora sp. CPCC 205371]|nr:large conductance mechanosensitive channel protein MscL [Micromonospora sp. CPCC 205371]